MRKIKVLVVDDERSAREELKRSLSIYPDFEILGEARNAEEARQQIEKFNPELIFLDIQMPEGSGFDLLESLGEVPQVIFTTAFDQYAVRAFEVNALDYLMKPVREERFAKAIDKTRSILLGNSRVAIHKQLFIRDGEKRYFVRMSEIHLIESLDNYSRLHFEKGKAVLKKSLNYWEEMLDNSHFFRISRTEIINLGYIEQVEPGSKGRLRLKLRTGKWLNVSSRQSARFRSLNRI
jgi:two-component system, LytTR family, response regulator